MEREPICQRRDNHLFQNVAGVIFDFQTFSNFRFQAFSNPLLDLDADLAVDNLYNAFLLVCLITLLITHNYTQ